MASGNINITLSVPAGSSNHGDPRFLCEPPKWYDFVVFFFSNYFAHAATVISVPGQPWIETVEVALFALLLPMSGAARAVSAIRNHAATYRDPMTQAARAGALCMVGLSGLKHVNKTTKGKRQWWEVDDRHVYETSLEIADTKICGKYKLSNGYCLLQVPPTAAVSTPKGEIESKSEKYYALVSSYNVPKLLISFIQAIWATVSLYRARGDQIERYGYAAFGLTVAQYAFMSVVNIIGNILRPEYPHVYMIRTPLMDKAEKAGCVFEGELVPQIDEGEYLGSWFAKGVFTELWIGFLLGLIPLAIVGGLSEFRTKASTPLERGFTITWLVVSLLIGPCFRFVHAGFGDVSLRDRLIFVGTFVCLFGVPAIGGMVVVGRMIQKFGMCSLVG
jgi:hypothetical protein